MTQNKKIIRVGVIGCGSIAKFRHLPELEFHPQVEIVAVCDANEERASKIARLYKTIFYINYQDLLNDTNIDAVIICLPHHLHSKVTIEAAKLGKHILCEKPIATNLEEAKEMIAMAKKNNVQLMIGHNQRFVPSHIKAKKILETGDLGKVTSFKSSFGHSGPENWSVEGKNNFYFNDELIPFGVIGDLAIHKIDLIHHLLNEPIIHVSAMSETFQKPTKHEDTSILLARTQSGVIGTITASWTYATQENATVLYCEKGVIRMEEGGEFPLVVQYHNKNAEYYKYPDILMYEKKEKTRSGVVFSFINSLLDGTDVPVNGYSGYFALSVVLAALEAEKTQSIVDVSTIMEEKYALSNNK
jgi:predicted dehydrogenase